MLEIVRHNPILSIRYVLQTPQEPARRSVLSELVSGSTQGKARWQKQGLTTNLIRSNSREVKTTQKNIKIIMRQVFLIRLSDRWLHGYTSRQRQLRTG